MKMRPRRTAGSATSANRAGRQAFEHHIGRIGQAGQRCEAAAANGMRQASCAPFARRAPRRRPVQCPASRPHRRGGLRAKPMAPRPATPSFSGFLHDPMSPRVAGVAHQPLAGCRLGACRSALPLGISLGYCASQQEAKNDLGRRNVKRLILSFAAAACTFALATAASAQYPDRAIKMIVPWAAGGDTDNIFRPFAPLAAEAHRPDGRHRQRRRRVGNGRRARGQGRGGGRLHPLRRARLHPPRPITPASPT